MLSSRISYASTEPQKFGSFFLPKDCFVVCFCGGAKVVQQSYKREVCEEMMGPHKKRCSCVVEVFFQLFCCCFLVVVVLFYCCCCRVVVVCLIVIMVVVVFFAGVVSLCGCCVSCGCWCCSCGCVGC